MNTLNSSSKQIGQLYPVLVDRNGNIIDGQHRLSANRNWKRLEVEQIFTKKDFLIARIISNVVRRVVSPKEKTEMLGQLAETYNGDVPRGKIAHQIASDTGMSYTWVVKYLPQRFKDPIQARRGVGVSRAKQFSVIDEVFDAPKQETVIGVTKYSNTDFTTLTVERQFYNTFERNSQVLGIPVEVSLSKALEQFNVKMKKTLITLRREAAITHEDIASTPLLNK